MRKSTSFQGFSPTRPGNEVVRKFGSESELGKWQKNLHLLMPQNCCLNRSKYHQKDYNCFIKIAW